MKQQTQTLREKAINWWNSLPFDSSNTTISKKHFFEQYNKNHYTPAKDYSEITGREAQIIYEYYTNDDMYSTDIESPKNYVGTRFTNLSTSEQNTCTVTNQTNIDVLVKWFGGMKSYTIDYFEMNIQDGVFVIVPDNSEVLPVPTERPFIGLMPCKDLAYAIHQHCFDYKNMETVVEGETIEHRIWDCYNTLFYVIKKWIDADEKDFIDYVKKSNPVLVGRECEWNDTDNDVLPVHKSIKVDDDVVPSVCDSLGELLKQHSIIEEKILAIDNMALIRKALNELNIDSSDVTHTYSEDDMKFMFECGRNFQLNGEVTFKESLQHIKQQKLNKRL